MPVIYLDILLALNLFIDFVLLTATAAWRHLPHRRWRLIAAAGIGAVSACAVLLPTLPWWGCCLYDLAVAAIMVRVGFAWRGWRLYGQTLVSLFALSVGFGGLCTLIWQIFSPAGFQVINGTVYYDIPPLTLVILTVLSYAALTLFERVARPKLYGQRVYRLYAEYGGRQAVLTTLYDSGNLLTESFSGAPVIVVEKAALPGWNPPETAAEAIKQGFRMIPFRSMGGEGLRPAFRPERLQLQIGGHPPQILDGVYLAVTEHLGHGEYQAVIGTAVLELLNTERMETV